MSATSTATTGATSAERELLAIADRVVAQAAPGEQVEAFVARDAQTEVKVYGGEIEEFVSAQSEGVGIRVIRDGRTGFAYAGTLDPAVISEVLAEARANVAFGTPDEYAGMAEPDDHPVTEVELWSDALDGYAVQDKIRLAMELEARALAADGRVRVESANYVDGATTAAIANSAGVRRAGRENGCYLAAYALAEERDEVQVGFGFSVGRSPEALDLGQAARDAAERSTRMLGATKPTSKRTTIVLTPYVASHFLGIIGGTLSGESVSKGRSLFRDRLGEAIANPMITLVDDPTNPLAFTATDVDGEGLAARRNVLIEGGVLRQFVHNSYSARRMGVASTGNAVRGGFKGTPGVGCLALQLLPGARAQAELIADIADGVLIHEVSGLHSGVNPISGDFSTGAVGMTISNGQIGAPLREFTLGSTLQRMLLDVIEIGNDTEWLPWSSSGVSMVIGDVTLSGA